MRFFSQWLTFLMILGSCDNGVKIKRHNLTMDGEIVIKNFENETQDLKSVCDVIILSGEDNRSGIAICPDLGGRVMTSTLSGVEGPGIGWIDHELIRSVISGKNFENFGGEDRLSLGPEGESYSLKFKAGMKVPAWKTLASPGSNAEKFELVEMDGNRVWFKKEMQLENQSGYVLTIRIDREIRLLNHQQISGILGVTVGNLGCVGFESRNSVTNKGETSWSEKNGIVSIGILGKFRCSPATTIIIPLKRESDRPVDPEINDTSYGKIPGTRLKLEDSVLFFLADGKERGKISISPENAKSFIGSYDEDENLLTIISLSPGSGQMNEVNRVQGSHSEPLRGAVLNAYNDGPHEDGSPGGAYYELGSISPPSGLDPGSILTHTHCTIHLTGDKTKLDEIVQRIFGVSLAEVYAAF